MDAVVFKGAHPVAVDAPGRLPADLEIALDLVDGWQPPERGGPQGELEVLTLFAGGAGHGSCRQLPEGALGGAVGDGQGLDQLVRQARIAGIADRVLNVAGDRFDAVAQAERCARWRCYA